MFTVYDCYMIADTEIGDDEKARTKIQQERFSKNMYAAELRVKDGQAYLVAESSKSEFDGDTIKEILDTHDYLPRKSIDLYIVFPDGEVSEIGGYYVDIDNEGDEFLVFYPD